MGYKYFKPVKLHPYICRHAIMKNKCPMRSQCCIEKKNCCPFLLSICKLKVHMHRGHNLCYLALYLIWVALFCHKTGEIKGCYFLYYSLVSVILCIYILKKV